jgi:transcriptional regulator with PAS, ATPase and Fis domain
MDFKFKDIHIGSLIQQLVQEQEVEPERIVNFLKVTDDEIELMYELKSMDTEMLLRWSKLLEYDFFRIYSQHLVWYAPAYTQKKKPSKKAQESKLPQFRKNIYTAELIKFIVELVQSGKKQKSEIIKEYRIPKNTLYKWLKKHGKEDDPEL